MALGKGGGCQPVQIEAKIAPGFRASPRDRSAARNAASSRSTGARRLATRPRTMTKNPTDATSLRWCASRQASDWTRGASAPGRAFSSSLRGRMGAGGPEVVGVAEGSSWGILGDVVAGSGGAGGSEAISSGRETSVTLRPSPSPPFLGVAHP